MLILSCTLKTLILNVSSKVYVLSLSQRHSTIQSKYFITDVCKCMHDMYDMQIDMHDPNGSAVVLSLCSQLRV